LVALYAQRLFSLLARSDVIIHAYDARWLALVVFENHPPAVDPVNRTVGPDHPPLSARDACLRGLRHEAAKVVAVLRVDQGNEVLNGNRAGPGSSPNITSVVGIQ